METIYVLTDSGCDIDCAAHSIKDIVKKMIDDEYLDDYTLVADYELNTMSPLLELYGPDWREGLLDISMRVFNEVFIDSWHITATNLI